jgi:hypothetical protein
MSHPTFYNKDFTLTDYSLSCGYIEKTTIGDVEITLSKPSPGLRCYLVRAYNTEEKQRLEYHSFTSLPEARKAWKRLINIYKS